MTEETFTDNDIRAKLTSGESLDFAWNVGRALSDWLAAEGSVVVLRQDQVNEDLVKAVIEGSRLQGRGVCDAGTGNYETLKSTIQNGGYAGGVLLGTSESDNHIVIELYKDSAELIDSRTGLSDIEMMIESGNMAPSATKGELTQLA